MANEKRPQSRNRSSKREIEANASVLEFQQNMMLYGINTPVCAIYLVTKPEFSVGYSSDCDAVLSFSREISRHHARIIWENGIYSVIDSNSTNHTFLNGKVLEPEKSYELRGGDQLSFASFLFDVKIISF